MKNLKTIKLNKEYKRAYFQGSYKAHPLIVTYLIKNGLLENRIGITTSKKIGKAFARNRARRIIRAAYLNIRQQLSFETGYDIVFVARADTAKAKSSDLEPILIKQIQFLLSLKIKKKKYK